jgi:hypothetical protein
MQLFFIFLVIASLVTTMSVAFSVESQATLYVWQGGGCRLP